MDKVKGILKDVTDAVKKLVPADLLTHFQQLEKLGTPPKRSPGTPMKFPYTFSAKIAQFPIRYHMKHNWMYKYYFVGIIASIPIFFKISRLSNSPGNKQKWAELKRKEAKELEEHLH